MKRGALFVMLIMLALIMAACTTSGELHITDVWARPGLSGGTSAAYFSIENPSSQTDTLLKANATISDAVEIHQTIPVGEGEMNGGGGEGHGEGGGQGMGEGHGDGAGQGGGLGGMKMVPVENLEIPKEGVEFKPGGLHVMFIGLKDDLKAGDEFTLTLTFENAGDITVNVPVKEY